MRILVVEDDPAIALLIETLLETNKYAVDVAIDGQAGLDLSDASAYFRARSSCRHSVSID
jgi:DNA-binding response OmpR family regulator